MNAVGWRMQLASNLLGSSLLGSFTTSEHDRPDDTAFAVATPRAATAAAAQSAAKAMSPRPTRLRFSSESARRAPNQTSPATIPAPTSASTPKTAPSATRSERVATSSVRAGLVNAQAPTSTAGLADARSRRPLSTRSLESANQRTSTPTATRTPARERVSMSESVAP